MNNANNMNMYTNYVITDDTTDITIFMQLRDRINRVILNTRNARKIRTDRSADRLPTVPTAIYTILILTTKVSKIFIISENNSKP